LNLEARKTCDCASCRYGVKVRDLMERAPSPDDKKFIEDLYERLICAEDNGDYLEMKRRELGDQHERAYCLRAIKSEMEAREGLRQADAVSALRMVGSLISGGTHAYPQITEKS
jgi:hypothetical protein